MFSRTGGGLVIVACAWLLSSCGPQLSETAAEAAKPVGWPAADLSTPDKAIKAYWAARDALRSYNQRVAKAYEARWVELNKELQAYATKGVADTLITGGSRNPLTFDREIAEVKVESESRAVVVAVVRPTTPVPAGAEVGRYTEGRRRDGDRYRYILEKDAKGWRVAEVYEWQTYPKPDWKKTAPGDKKPYVETLTDEGA